VVLLEPVTTETGDIEIMGNDDDDDDDVDDELDDGAVVVVVVEDGSDGAVPQGRRPPREELFGW